MQSIRISQTKQKVAAAIALLALAIGLAFSGASPVTFEAAKPDKANSQQTVNVEMSNAYRGSTWG